jgi:ADP-ribose pyrophosphatase YjhB (NUDIX family)
MKVRATAIIIDGEKVLLVKHRRRGLSYWAFPGGQVKESETIIDALKREIAEETGLEIEPGRLLYVAETIDPEMAGVHTVNLFFLAQPKSKLKEPVGPIPGEHLDVPKFTPINDLPNLELYPDIADMIRISYETEFREEGLYLGNLWSKTKKT